MELYKFLNMNTTAQMSQREHFRPDRSFLGVPTWAWVLGLILGTIGFFITLWLTEPARMPNIQVLLKTAILDDASLLAATKAAGLKESPSVTGYIDIIKRIDNGQVVLGGWAVEIGGKDLPLTLLAFTDGKRAFTTETKSQRPDVMAALKLRPGAASNVAFQLMLSCSPGQKVTLIAVTRSNAFARLGSPACP